MMPTRSLLLAVGSALALSACAHYPVGPSLMVLPGTGKDFSRFQDDDAMCRDYASSTLQSRYDNAYLQCMYANGNQIPVPPGSFAASSTYTSQATPHRPPPPPPAGPAPAPPPY